MNTSLDISILTRSLSPTLAEIKSLDYVPRMHIDLCFLVGCYDLCFHKATSVFIASLDRIYTGAAYRLPFYVCMMVIASRHCRMVKQVLDNCLHDGEYLQTILSSFPYN